MQVNKEIVDNLIKEFSSLKNRNTISEKNLTKFNKNSKEDMMYLSFFNLEGDNKYLTFLPFLVNKLKPANIVELGNREGLSTIAIYDAIKKSNIPFYSIDIEKDLRYCPKHMFSDPQMHFLFGDVCDLDVVEKLPKKIDILFTDTLHFDFQLRDEWEVYQHLLSDVALVAIDDINVNDKRKLFDEINFAKWDLTELCHLSGWGLFLFERKVSQNEVEQKEKLHKSVAAVWKRKYESLFTTTKQKEDKRLVSIAKSMVKKIPIIYKPYTFIFNNLNKILNKDRRVVYGGKIRL